MELQSRPRLPSAQRFDHFQHSVSQVVDQWLCVYVGPKPKGGGCPRDYAVERLQSRGHHGVGEAHQELETRQGHGLLSQAF